MEVIQPGLHFVCSLNICFGLTWEFYISIDFSGIQRCWSARTTCNENKGKTRQNKLNRREYFSPQRAMTLFNDRKVNVILSTPILHPFCLHYIMKMFHLLSTLVDDSTKRWWSLWDNLWYDLTAKNCQRTSLEKFSRVADHGLSYLQVNTLSNDKISHWFPSPLYRRFSP